MNRKMIFLNLLISLQLTIGSVAPAYAQANSCPAGLVYDSSLNRCLTSEQTAKIMNATSSCPAGDVKCYRDNAEAALKEKEDKGEVKAQLKDKGGMPMKAAAVALPLLLAVGGMKGKKCASASFMAMVGGGTALFVGDLLSTRQHKKRLKDIEKEWNSIIKPGSDKETNGDNKRANATEAQSQAFEMLARSEDSLAAAAKMKSLFFGVSMAAFAAAAVLASLEMFPSGGMICKSADTNQTLNQMQDSPIQNFNQPGQLNVGPSTGFIPTKYHQSGLNNLAAAEDLASYLIIKHSLENPSSSYSSPSITDFENVSSILKKAKIDEDKDLLSLLKGFASKAFQELNPIPEAHAVPGISQLMTHSTTRIVLGGILAGWSYTMYAHAKKQAKISTERAELLRKMRDEFNQASGSINSCTSNERSNPANPTCYCYTSEGQRNPARTNSQVCTALFRGRNLTGKVTDTAANGAPKGCVSSAGQFDEKCTCKASNSCLKATSTNMQGFNPGSFSMLNGALSPVDKIGDGTAGSANVSGDASVNTALRLLDAQKKLENEKKFAKIKAGRGKLESQIEGALMANGAGTSPNFLGDSAPLPSSPAQAASLLEKEISASETARTNVGSGEGQSISGSTAAAPEQLEFGLTNDQLAEQETQIAQVMQENLDYGTNDINNGSGVSIFELVSNRYQRSGMKRLFDKDGKVIPEKPAATEISDK